MALANVELTNTFDEWRTRTNQIIVQGEQTLVNVSTLFTRVDNGNLWANSVGTRSNTYSDSVGVRANTYSDSVGVRANTYSDSVGVRANTYSDSVGVRANTYADSVGVRANNYSITYADAVGVRANTYADSVGLRANNFATSAVATEAALARSATNLTSGTIPVARVSGNYNLITGVGTLNAVTITGGSITGITDITLADGGTGATLTACSGAVVYSTSSAFAFTAVGSSGQLLQSTATGAPSWVSPASLTVSRSSTTGTADNSNLLGGLAGQYSATASSVAFRDGAADVTARLFRAEYQNESSMSGAIAFRNAAGAGADNYTRYCSSPLAVRGWLSAGYELLWSLAVAGYSSATVSWGGGNLVGYRQLYIVGVDASHNSNATGGRAFQINNITCSDAFLSAGVWSGTVTIDLYTGVGFYVDQGATIAARSFGIYQSTTSFLLDLSGTGTMDSGAVYVFGVRGTN